jgi:hypothetical protein
MFAKEVPCTSGGGGLILPIMVSGETLFREPHKMSIPVFSFQNGDSM